MSISCDLASIVPSGIKMLIPINIASKKLSEAKVYLLIIDTKDFGFTGFDECPQALQKLEFASKELPHSLQKLCCTTIGSSIFVASPQI